MKKIANKEQVRISNPDELNKYLQHTNPLTWVLLGLVIALLVAFFAWSFIYKLTIKVIGKADVNSGVVTLHVKEADLGKIKVGQKVYIDKYVLTISSIEDKEPVVSDTVPLEDKSYNYTIVIGETRPIDFLLNK